MWKSEECTGYCQESEENQSRMWRLKRRMEKKKEEAAKKLKENEEKSDEDK